ncbi:hypothetical protein [Shimazuella kribbensis]|uniref:hypothetical protein n=1 Tax=Shimazuella kribbensis TaxID=139808 RepID=UPI00048D1662|nr:hypothetical protein [Shimazuella kribbensis]
MNIATNAPGNFSEGKELILYHNQGCLKYEDIAWSTEGIELTGVTYELTVPPKRLFGVLPIGRKSVRKGHYGKAMVHYGKAMVNHRVITFTHIAEFFDDKTVVRFDESNKITTVEGDRL